MKAVFTDDQKLLAATAEDMAAGGRAAARALLDGGHVPAEPTGSLFAGFAALGIPEEAGGDGGSLVDLAIVVEALGRTITPTPFVAHVAAVQLAYGAGLDPATGGRRWAPAVDQNAADTWVGVVEGGACDAAVVVGDAAVAIAAPAGREPRESLDATRPVADLTFGDLSWPVSDAAAGLARATVVAAADLCGVGRGAVAQGVEHASQREQFGGSIGRFQGVAHQLADAYAGVEAAWSLTLYACWALDAAAPGADLAVRAAKASAGEAAVFAAERSMQVHGGMGMTWEADPHLYLRRALAADSWMGGHLHHRRALGTALLAGRP